MEELEKAFKHLPMATTEQLSILIASKYRSPNKRMSEKLKSMEDEGILESQRMENMQKVWRLTRRGRNRLNPTYMTCPLGSLKRQHYLRIADLYFKLLPRNLKAFDVEPREKYSKLGRETAYAPDVFAIFDGKPYIIEVQIKTRSRKEWERKWSLANEYFDRADRHFYDASWNKYAGKPFIPHFIVVTNQNPEIVRTGFAVSGRELMIWE